MAKRGGRKRGGRKRGGVLSGIPMGRVAMTRVLNTLPSPRRMPIISSPVRLIRGGGRKIGGDMFLRGRPPGQNLNWATIFG